MKNVLIVPVQTCKNVEAIVTIRVGVVGFESSSYVIKLN